MPRFTDPTGDARTDNARAGDAPTGDARDDVRGDAVRSGDAYAGDVPTGEARGDAVRSEPAALNAGTQALLEKLLAGIERELPGAIELRHRLHAQPELAHAEHATAAAVADALPVPSLAVAGTGRIARVGPVHGPGVAVRAELDALSISERTGAPYSAPAGAGAMHACGHDVHMAALVALARAAHALAGELPAALLAVLQPSEEAYPSGAEELACELSRSGSLSHSPDPADSANPPELANPAQPSSSAHLANAADASNAAEVSGAPAPGLAPAAIVAAHVHPELPWGAVALDAGTVNASCDHAHLTIEGQPAHGAYPHRGRDPILALAEIVVALHAQAGRRIDPLRPASLTVGVLEAGSAENVIPERAHARVALRAHRREDRLALREMVGQVVAGVAAAHGVRGTVELTAGEPALENDAAIIARARELLAGAGLRAAPEWRSCGSDDFAFFGRLNVPLAMGFVGLDGAGGFTVRPLHHPQLLVPDAAVGAVARAQAVLYLAATSMLGRTAA